MITVSEESAVDFESTARIATEAFGSKDITFSASRMKWLYERAFGRGAAVVAAFDGDKKIGQIVLLHQNVHLDGEPAIATQLIDLFILQAYRSRALIQSLYEEAERLCEANHIRIVLTLPNEKSARLNARFMKLHPFLSLPVRVGLCLGRPRSTRLAFSTPINAIAKEEAIRRLSTFATPASQNGPHWDAETLLERISDPTRDYAMHATADLLLVSSSRKTRGINHVLLCGFFTRPGALINSADIGALIDAACRLRKRRIFAYAGINSSLPRLPGLALPGRFRQPILIQLRDTSTEAMPRFDRFELIDSDFV